MEVEERLKKEPAVAQCLEQKLFDDNVLHDKVLSSLASQREAPKKHAMVRISLEVHLLIIRAV
jgi:hypothetical protein